MGVVMQYRSRQILRLSLLAAGAMTLAGCDSIRDAAGTTKAPPDEFAVVTKSPLIIPPDYNLHPPRDGAPPTNQAEPTDAAQSALFAADPAAAAKSLPSDYSEAEKQLLASANAVNANPGIRQQIAADGRAMETADDGFAKKVLFWQEPKKDTGTNVDADAEAKRIDAQKTAGEAGAKKPADNSATIQKDAPKSSGWFGDLF
jgi:hypothetical protein